MVALSCWFYAYMPLISARTVCARGGRRIVYEDKDPFSLPSRGGLPVLLGTPVGRQDSPRLLDCRLRIPD